MPVNPDMGRCRHGRGRGEGGAIAILSALISLTLLVVAAFAVDIGHTWAERGKLQFQADKAALLAAEALPAVDAASRLEVAKYAAYYFACHTRPGQRTLSTIPACPDGTTPSSAQIQGYGQKLLDEGLVSFPTSTQVKVVTPPAYVDYGFGKAAGVDGTTQQKMAIAQVSSPGILMPMGLSLQCLLSAAGTVPAVGDPASLVLPLNYITPGPLKPSPANVTTTWPSSGPATQTKPTIASFSTTPDPVVGGGSAVFTLTGQNWAALNVLGVPVLGDVKVVFGRGTRFVEVSPTTTLGAGLVGTATGPVPAEVLQEPGTWEVKVRVRSLGWADYRWSSESRSFTVMMPASAEEFLGCSRTLTSPRADATHVQQALSRNLQEGLDHTLLGHPSLVSLTAPDMNLADIQSALTSTSLLGCSNNGDPHVLDLPNPRRTPNCVQLTNNEGWLANSFTEGMLGAPSGGVAGRLVCTTTRDCNRSVHLDELNVDINDDDFDDYVLDHNLLRQQMWFSLSTYVTDGIPVVTPQSAISEAIYGSHRFMWVPVIGAPITATSAGHYPILTFRPIFITQDAPEGFGQVDTLFDSMAGLLEDLRIVEDDVEHGLLLSEDGKTLRAMRFMTIEPAALPRVDNSYEGPTSEYLGVGPKILQLVK